MQFSCIREKFKVAAAQVQFAKEQQIIEEAKQQLLIQQHEELFAKFRELHPSDASKYKK